MPNRQNITQHKESSHQLLAKANPMCEENSQHFLLQFYPLNSAQLKNVLEPEKILRNSFHTGFGCQEDTILCGIFDGHGPWGHYVAKAVRDSLPPSLLCHWQEALALASVIDGEKRLGDCQFDLWKQSYMAACAAVDDELRRSRRFDAVQSGCTALSIVKQGDLMVIANVGDSRAVLGTTSDDGSVAAVQLTVDFKPNLPQEKERIRRCNGQVYCLADEPGVHRVWQPNRESPGLAMSRAFGDYCVKDCGVISVPEVTQRRITSGGVGRALQRRGRADRGGDAGPGEGGQAAGGVRRPRVEAQAARHRCRRLLGDLPLLPLAALVDTKPERASVHVKERQQNAHLKTAIIVPVAFVVETRECMAAVHTIQNVQFVA
ncbi:probable protein phosphatase 2C 48 isoform X2 [Miscanthus floridulus]|uniref:probable protein phosphatase 2C 48 isoform X2 n=1 Tax=Miscanthus floridulus TaxID=154761 RepID=UPI0034593A2D